MEERDNTARWTRPLNIQRCSLLMLEYLVFDKNTSMAGLKRLIWSKRTTICFLAITLIKERESIAVIQTLYKDRSCINERPVIAQIRLSFDRVHII